MKLPPEDIHQRLLVARLPSPPQTLMRLMVLCQSEDAGMGELSELIASDPGLSAKVLSVAHSAAYYRSSAKTLTLLQATSTLGMALIKVLAISESVFQTFHAFRQTTSNDLRRFWKHSLGVAVLARALAERHDSVGAEEAYLTGLLHDVGRLALLVAVPERYSALFGLPDDASLCGQEQQQLGTTHAEAGAWLLTHWHLSPSMAQSVLAHHNPPSRLADNRPLTRLIHLAHLLESLPAEPVEALPDWASEHGLSQADITELLQTTATQVAQIARDLGVDISDTGEPSAASLAVTRPQPLDADQSALARDVLDRSVLNEMAMTLINLTSTNAALTSMRQHASALLQLEDAMVMLTRDNQQTLVPVSMNERHLPATPLAFEVAHDPSMAHCMAQRKVVFSKRQGLSPSVLLDVMDTNEVVLLPLLTAQQCLGVLAASVPPELSQHLRSQLPTLQAFGVYAGLALSRRRLADKNRSGQTLSAKEAQTLELKRVVQAVDLLVDALSKTPQPATMVPVDLSLAVRDTVQLLQHRQLIPGNIEVNAEMPNRAAWVQGSPGKIKQILLILIKNACETMPDGGQIMVNGGGLVQRDGGVYTVLTVADSAAGTKEAIQAQLYENAPEATRSNRGQPVFGLATVNQLLERMAGHIKFSTGPSGTRFDILLPCPRNPTV